MMWYVLSGSPARGLADRLVLVIRWLASWDATNSALRPAGLMVSGGLTGVGTDRSLASPADPTAGAAALSQAAEAHYCTNNRNGKIRKFLLLLHSSVM